MVSSAPPARAPEHVVCVTVRATNLYLIAIPGGYALFDCGWAGTLALFQRELARRDVDWQRIRWLMISHCDPDHAGLAPALRRATGAKLLLHEIQPPFLETMRPYGSNPAERAAFEPLAPAAGDQILPEDNRAALRATGLHGALLATPDHSPDSISLLLDSGLAFTGDLPMPYVDPAAAATWRRLAALGAKTIYPAHGPSAPVEQVLKGMDP